MMCSSERNADASAMTPSADINENTGAMRKMM